MVLSENYLYPIEARNYRFIGVTAQPTSDIACFGPTGDTVLKRDTRVLDVLPHFPYFINMGFA